MDIVERAKSILLDPKRAWGAIEAEPATPQSIYVPYVVALAAIPAVASFIGLSFVGFGGGAGMHVRIPLAAGLAQMVVGYALSLVMVYVVALIVDVLAPTFGGQRDRIAALKLVAYAATAGFVAGVVNVLPSLSMLGLLGALYSIYLVYLGLPVLMKCPPEKAVAYTATVVGAAFVAGIVAAAVAMAIAPMPMNPAMR